MRIQPDIDTMSASSYRSLLPVLICAVVLSGCGRKAAAPSAPEPRTLSGMTRDRTHYTFLKWDEGLAVMLVDWCDVHHMKGSSRSGGLDQRKGDAHWWDKDFHQWEVGYEWKLETSDGRTATFTINNFEYDLSKGGAFRIDTGGDEVVVTQVDQDVSKIPLKKNACDHFLTSTSELTKPSKDANEDNQ